MVAGGRADGCVVMGMVLEQANIAVSACKFAGELVAMFSMDRVGRKPLFFAR